MTDIKGEVGRAIDHAEQHRLDLVTAQGFHVADFKNRCFDKIRPFDEIVLLPDGQEPGAGAGELFVQPG